MLRKHARALEKVVAAYTDGVEKHAPDASRVRGRPCWTSWPPTTPSFTVDTGMCNVWAARYITPNGRRRIIGSFRHGTMANALPHAIGAAARPARPAGGVHVRRRRPDHAAGRVAHRAGPECPVKIIAFNNASLGMVRLEMMVAGIRRSRPTTAFPTCAAIARACGVPAEVSTIRLSCAASLDRPGLSRPVPGRRASPTPTPCPSRPTSRRPRSAASPSPPPARSWTEA